MKKHLLFRSFLALMMLLFVGNAWGDGTTIFSYEFPAIGTTSLADYQSEFSSAQTATGGTIVLGAPKKIEASTLTSSGVAYKLDGDAAQDNTKYALITLSGSEIFAAGDVITLHGYSTSSTGYLFALCDSRSGTGKVTTGTNCTKSLTVSTYTVTASDCLVGKNTLYVTRDNNNSLYFCDITITRPAPATKRVYLDPTSEWADSSNKWTDAGAKTGIYDATAGKWLGLMNEGEDCYAGYLYYDVATTCETVVFARFDPNSLPSFPVTGWDITGMWSQSVDVNITTNDLFKMVGYGTYGTDEGKAYGETAVFSLPTYTVTYVAGLHGTGTMVDEDNYICGNEATVLANGFTADANYSFAGYKDQEGNDVAAGDVIEMHKNLTLTAQWSLNADGTVVYNWNTVGTIVKYGTATVDESVKIKNVNTNGIKFANGLVSVKDNLVTGTNHITILPADNNGFKAGDIITWTGCIYNNKAEKDGAITLVKSYTISADKSTYDIDYILETSAKFNNTYDVSVEASTGTFVLTEDVDSIVIARTNKDLSSPTATWLTQLTVTRPTTTTLTLSNVAEAEYGFATFCGEANYTVSGAKAYKAELSNNNELSLTELTGVIPAGDAEFANGVIIAGEVGATATITYTSKEATAEIDGNILLGTTEPTATADLKGSNTYLMVLNKTTNNFGSFEGAELPANKACFAYSAPSAAPVRILMPGVKPIPTEINNNEESVKAIKTLIDGRLYILRDGNMFDLNGRLVK